MPLFIFKSTLLLLVSISEFKQFLIKKIRIFNSPTQYFLCLNGPLRAHILIQECCFSISFHGTCFKKVRFRYSRRIYSNFILIYKMVSEGNTYIRQSGRAHISVTSPQLAGPVFLNFLLLGGVIFPLHGFSLDISVTPSAGRQTS